MHDTGQQLYNASTATTSHHGSELEVLLAPLLPFQAVQHRLRLLVQVVEPRQLLQVVRLVEGAQEHIEPVFPVRIDHLTVSLMADY